MRDKNVSVGWKVMINFAAASRPARNRGEFLPKSPIVVLPKGVNRCAAIPRSAVDAFDVAPGARGADLTLAALPGAGTGSEGQIQSSTRNK